MCEFAKPIVTNKLFGTKTLLETFFFNPSILKLRRIVGFVVFAWGHNILELLCLSERLDHCYVSGTKLILSQPQYMVVSFQRNKSSEMTCDIEFSAHWRSAIIIRKVNIQMPNF